MRSALAMFCIVLLCGWAIAQPNYSGVYGGYPHCQACHSSGIGTDQYPHWRSTAHSLAYDSHAELQWNPTCLPCHTTGWDIALNNGGFDDYFYAGDTLGMQQMRNVQCESCHGPTDQFPHPATTLVDYHAEVCGDCHTGVGRPTYDEWSSCRHGRVASTPAQQLACAKCHEVASAATFLATGNPPGGLQNNPIWQVACAACHAAHADTTYGAQLRLEGEDLCRTCHTMEGAVVGEEPHSPQKEMVLGMGYGGFEWPGYVYNNSCHETYLPSPCVMCHMYTSVYGNPDPVTTGHSLEPRIMLCATPGCHDQVIPPDSSFNINNCQTETDSLLEVLGVLLALSDTTTIEYAQAKFDYDFVANDGSHGVHNFFYARDLLMSSIEGLPPVGVPPTRTEQPLDFRLLPPRPNPFNPSTVASFELRVASHVNLRIYDTAGKLVQTLIDAWLPAGEHQAIFDGSNLASGVYLLRIQAGEYVGVEKLVLLK